jgi:hypothetical protein
MYIISGIQNYIDIKRLTKGTRATQITGLALGAKTAYISPLFAGIEILLIFVTRGRGQDATGTIRGSTGRGLTNDPITVIAKAICFKGINGFEVDCIAFIGIVNGLLF